MVTKLDSLFQTITEIMRGKKIIIFMSASPHQGDIFFPKSDIAWACTKVEKSQSQSFYVRFIL